MDSEEGFLMRGIMVALCLLFTLAGCTGMPLPPLLPAAADTGPYRLDTGDVVRVLVYNQESLSTEYTVGDNGTISIPTLGEIRARALTAQELQKVIFDGLNNGVLVNPGVSVQLAQYRPFYIVGEVAKPGQYPFTPGLNVLGAVAVAGGFTIRADQRQMTVVRTQGNRGGEWSADPLVEVRPGDVIVIREQYF
jgi:polysaccharide export outer membrane protein